MAHFTTGYEWGPTEDVTPTKMHRMVDSAVMVAVLQGDLQSGTRLVYITALASPNTGDVRIGPTGLLEFYYSAAWQTQPIEPLLLPMTNKSGLALVRGDVVVPDPTNADSFTVATLDVTNNVLGVLAEDIASNATGLVCLRGECVVNIDGLAIPTKAGTILRGPDGTAFGGATLAKTVPSLGFGPPRSDAFGILLEHWDGNVSSQERPAYIWK